jgi:hypothetical protein
MIVQPVEHGSITPTQFQPMMPTISKEPKTASRKSNVTGDVRGATRLIERHVAGTGSEIAEVLRDRDRVRRATQK